ncbi:hypothetical protein LCM4579_27015 [Ensifer sp. LCM 4579]|nr:hypothetical protein LCM4579_27015 [Ensifer sp. LCM 4579]
MSTPPEPAADGEGRAATGVRPRIETMPLERAQEAVQKMRSGEANFRMVLTMGGRSNAHQ